VSTDDPHAVVDEAGLAALYTQPSGNALAKVLDHVSEDYRRFIEAAPFVVLATGGPHGLDVSPRGDPAPVATVLDSATLALPDRPGNNRLDSLRNILRDPRVALLFLIPGIGETMRVQGRARITTDPGLMTRFSVNGRPPVSVLVISVERVYFQCQKALRRSALWEPAAQVDRQSLPSTGEMLQTMTDGAVDGPAYDADYPDRMKRTLY